ncbi:MAG TPA: branched-chain amino acid ABC transporter permease, partial [Gammaproteobacteria bacterium]|nr:branched-chain amino acid ABC transporter permease [Gammaproteobacteria bacterium]
IPLGYISTKRGGVSFAMITLGIGELVAASSLMFTGFFGGEAGVPTNRVTEVTLLPFDYGPSIQVYYLIVAWMLLSAIAMYLLTKTPLGKMANAVRDNRERAEFVGYSPRMVSFIQFSIAGFFAGVAGGLFAINYEILTADTLGANVSGIVLLMTFVGGVGYFFGPILGAILITYLSTALSGITEAWLLYFGLMFVLMVMFAPSGLAGIVMLHRPVWSAGQLGRLLVPYIVMAIPALLLFFGLSGVIEMAYHRSTSYDPSTPMQLFLWDNVVITTFMPWLIAVLAIVIGGFGLRWAARRFRVVWDEIHTTIAAGGRA